MELPGEPRGRRKDEGSLPRGYFLTRMIWKLGTCCWLSHLELDRLGMADNEACSAPLLLPNLTSPHASGASVGVTSGKGPEATRPPKLNAAAAYWILRAFAQEPHLTPQNCSIRLSRPHHRFSPSFLISGLSAASDSMRPTLSTIPTVAWAAEARSCAFN